MEEKVCDPFGGDGFLRGTENHPLSKPMVDHDQERIKAIGQGEIGDKVTGNLLKWSRARGGNGEQWGNGGMGIDLILLAGGATFNVLSDELSKSWPPEF